LGGEAVKTIIHSLPEHRPQASAVFQSRAGPPGPEREPEPPPEREPGPGREPPPEREREPAEREREPAEREREPAGFGVLRAERGRDG
jgi:hypothetical protein